MLSHHKKRVILALALYTLCIFSIIQLAQSSSTSMDRRNLVFALPHFLSGMIGCLIFSNKTASSVIGYLFLMAFLLVLGLASYMYHELPGRFWSWQGILLVDLAILLLVGFHQIFKTQTKLCKITKNLYRIFAWIGVLSYGIYAWHAYFLKYIPYFGQKISYLIFVSTIASLGSYFLIEKTALKMRKGHFVSLNEAKCAGLGPA
jgi:peptidoglycan/LPS O-acetylase OafA/YrhL